MTRYVIRRVALALVVVAGVVILTFVIADVVPGDPAASWAGPHASAAQIARARHYLGLDQPPAMLVLVIVALIIAVLAGIPLGLAAARWPGSLADHAIRVGAVLGVSMPI